MSFFSTLNGARRTVMRRVTRSLGTTRLNKQAHRYSPDRIRRILICRPNHRLGNLLLVTPLLQEVSSAFPNAKIDLFVKGNAAPVLFKHYQNIGRLIQLPKKPLKDIFRYMRGWISIKTNHYDLAINTVNASSSGKLSARFANSDLKFMGDIQPDTKERFDDHMHMAKYAVYSLRDNLRQLGMNISDKPVPPLDLRLSPAEIDEGKKLLHGLVQREKRTIGIYTYATGAKMYAAEWWEPFYERLQSLYPEFNIIEILPIENVSQIAFKAPSFYSKELRQIGALISNLDIFIGADSGMMHLASAAHAPVVGLFKADNINTYKPYNEGSVGVNTNDMSLDELLEVVDGVLRRKVATL